MNFGNRAWYRPPWKVTRPWIPRVSFFEHGDEFCNDVMEIQFPFMGVIAVRYRRGPIRTEPCDQMQTEWGPWCAGGVHCHFGPRCHEWAYCRHDVELGDCPTCGGMYCPLCEPEPEETCPTS